MTSSPSSPQASDIAAGLRMLLLDVDGVLTDGGIILIGRDEEAKQFNAQDGMGITIARAAGLKVGIVTSRSSHVVNRRAEELHIDEVFQGIGRKTEVLDQLLSRYEIEASQAAYIGDDIQDIPIMERVGMPIAVQNAAEAVKECSKYVTKASGGHGAVREAVDWLLELRGDKDKAYKTITG